MTPPDQEPTQVEDAELKEIEARANAAQHGPWIVANYRDADAIGKNWELADFGECAHHNKKVWVTTDRLNASQTNGACPCEDAEFASKARTDIPKLLAAYRRSEAARKETDADCRAMFKTLKDLQAIVRSADRHISIEQIVAVCAPLRENPAIDPLIASEHDRDEARREVENLTEELKLVSEQRDLVAAEAERKNAALEDIVLIAKPGSREKAIAEEAIRSEEQAR